MIVVRGETFKTRCSLNRFQLDFQTNSHLASMDPNKSYADRATTLGFECDSSKWSTSEALQIVLWKEFCYR
jgi:hypothetical protein